MLEMYFRNEKAAYIIELFELETEAQEIQISVTGNEFSIWKNKGGISRLLQDTTVDEIGLMLELEKLADEIER